MQRHILLGAAVLLCCFPALLPAEAQSASLQNILESKNKLIDEAFIKGNPAPIRLLFSTDATIINPVGARLGAEDLFSLVRTGTLKYRSINRSEEKLALYGHFAVLTYLSTETGTVQGRDLSGNYRWSEVWMEQEGQWKIVTAQGTRVVTER